MPDYDFRSLSPYDFEVLARDLIQQEMGIRLESFARGRDGGIDFRFQTRGGEIVVQCKHYPSDYAALARVLERDEVPKVRRLSPARYILVVSTPLTPLRKGELLALLTPFCHSSSDIYGREDLNNLLGRHPEVETKHVKLWLTSEAVLSRVLHGAIWGDAELTMERIRLKASRYVPNPSLSRAKSILDKHRYCVIAGIPGIGKTTLAEILLIEHVEQHGFQAVRIANVLSEIKAVRDPNSKQIFYFDDFLGTIRLDKLERNEDRRLMEFIQDVADNSNWRFVLTTREYILNAAKLRYESLAHPPVDLTPCVVRLDDYTYPIRAKILYNHIFFCDLPDSYKRALLENSNYKSILIHKNYNPRIIEHMTERRHVVHLPAEDYFRMFKDNLDNPARIWDHAFRNQLSEPAQHLLLLMASMPDEVLLIDLETAFVRFFQYRRARLGFAGSGRDFERGVKELDGNFIKTYMIGQDRVVSFHNPSVGDYLEFYLSEAAGDVVDLFESASFFDQFTRLWQGKGDIPFPGIELHRDRFLRAVAREFGAPYCKIMRQADGYGNVVGARAWQMPYETKISFAIDVAARLETPDSQAVVNELLDSLRRRLESGKGKRDSLAKLLRKLAPQLADSREIQLLFATASEFLTTNLNAIDDFNGVALFISDFPDSLAPSHLDRVRDEFRAFCEACDLWDPDPEWGRQLADQIEDVGEALGVDVEKVCSDLRENADDAERGEREPSDESEDSRDWSGGYAAPEDVDEMFEGLLQEIADRLSQ
jgi:hypothetical protein